MKTRSLLAAVLLSLLICASAMGFSKAEVEESAQQGLKQILNLWRMEDYEGLYSRLTHPPEHGWDYFAGLIVYASRIPACCWEQLQQVKTTAVGMDRAVVSAKVGLEVEGVGTRFETRDFHMDRIGDVWMLPMREILDLSRYNLQRIPRKIYERPL
jgi:hypothetical protein